MTTQYEITDGPSKFDLMMSHFAGRSGDKSRLAPIFKLRQHTVCAVIDRCEREDGSGERYIISGFAWFPKDPSTSRHYNAYYDCQRREGWMKFE